MKDAIRHTVRLKVAFSDLDPMHVVWHGNYLKYFDVARFGLFSAAGIDLYRYSMEKKIILPVTHTSTKYILPLRYGDEFDCLAVLREAAIKIVMDFEIRRVSDNLLCTRGRSDQVAVRLPDMEILFEIPPEVRAPLGFCG